MLKALNQNKQIYLSEDPALFDSRGLRPMLDTTPSPECYPQLNCYRADQKQPKHKNLYIIFFWW